MLGRNRDAKNAFASHGMAACAPIGKEVAGAVPRAVSECYGMDIILALEGRLKSSKLHTLGFLSILLCFCNLSNHTGVHRLYPLSCAFARNWPAFRPSVAERPC